MPEPDAPIDPTPAAPSDDILDTQLPEEVRGKSAAEVWRMVEVERARGAEAQVARQRAEAIAQEIAMAALDQRRAAPAEALAAAPAEPDRDSDPEAWMNYQIDKRVNERVRPMVDGYTRDRQMVVGGMLDNARARVASQFPDWSEHQAEIEAFVRNYPADVLAQPGALEEAYYRVKGRAVATRERETRIREQSGLEVHGRVGVGERRPEAPRLSEEQARVARNFDVAPDTYAALEGPGAVSIDEWVAMKDKMAKSRGGSNAAR